MLGILNITQLNVGQIYTKRALSLKAISARTVTLKAKFMLILCF